MIEDLEVQLKINFKKLDSFKRDTYYGLGAFGVGFVTLFTESAILGPNLLIPPVTPERVLVTSTLAFSAGAGLFVTTRMVQMLLSLRERIPLINERDRLNAEAQVRYVLEQQSKQAFNNS